MPVTYTQSTAVAYCPDCEYPLTLTADGAGYGCDCEDRVLPMADTYLEWNERAADENGILVIVARDIVDDGDVTNPDPWADDAVRVDADGTVTSSTLLDSAAYVRHGGLSWDTETFHALGGKRAEITPLWVHGGPVGGLVLLLNGTPDAVAYAESSLIV